jgi:hypothetical protein
MKGEGDAVAPLVANPVRQSGARTAAPWEHFFPAEGY